jgi:micrococcal nuclease
MDLPLRKRDIKLLSRFAFALVGVAIAAASRFWTGAGLLPGRPQTVKSVVDGDTVELSNGRMARYIGIDTPELKRRTGGDWEEVKEPYAEEARRLNEELVLGKALRLEYDVQRRDKYDRELVYCYAPREGKEILVQAELLRNGLAYLYTFPPNVAHIGELVTALREAKANKRGIWSQDLSISSTEANRYVGQRKIIEGTVSRARKSDKVITLTMEGLKIVIFKKDLVIFTKEGIDPAAFYKGKKIRAFGLIKTYRGATELIVSDPYQIEIVG